MPKISQIDEVPCQAEVRILQKITLNSSQQYNSKIQFNSFRNTVVNKCPFCRETAFSPFRWLVYLSLSRNLAFFPHIKLMINETLRILPRMNGALMKAVKNRLLQ